MVHWFQKKQKHGSKFWVGFQQKNDDGGSKVVHRFQ